MDVLKRGGLAAWVILLSACMAVEGPRPDPAARGVFVCEAEFLQGNELATDMAMMTAARRFRIADRCPVADWLGRREPVDFAGEAAAPAAPLGLPDSLRRLAAPVTVVPLAPAVPPGRPAGGAARP